MKKYIIAFLAALFLFLPTSKAVELPKKTNHEKVNVYLFYASWCTHCHDFIEYFSDKYQDYEDYFKIVTLQSDETNETNSKLMQLMAQYFKLDQVGYPFIVIGDKFQQAGFGSDGTNIIEEALKEYQNKNYKDAVKQVAKKNKITIEEKDILDACTVAGLSCGKSNENANLPEKTDHEKVKVYLFYASWCTHCHDFIKYFADKYQTYEDYFEIITLQSDETNATNGNLMQLMAQYFKLDQVGFPFIVIGDKFQQAGFGSDGTNIIEEALKEYQNKDYKDAVKEVASKNNITIEEKDLLNACTVAGINCTAKATEKKEVKSSKSDIIALAIVGVVVIGCSSLLYFGRKKK